MTALATIAACAACAALAGCGEESRCGPTHAVVVNVVDGDTVDLEGGERIRYLLIDTPELSSNDCYAQEARQANIDLVLDHEVKLTYDVQCTDNYGRLLAYVSVGDVEVNRRLVERGFACDLFIPPNGEDRREEFASLESLARSEGRGMWGACAEVACQ